MEGCEGGIRILTDSYASDMSCPSFAGRCVLGSHRNNPFHQTKGDSGSKTAMRLGESVFVGRGLSYYFEILRFVFNLHRRNDLWR